MNTTRKKLTDMHGDEIVYMHVDILDADMDSAEKIVMMVLRRMAFPSGWVCQHYKEIAKEARMPLSTVKNKGGVMDRLRGKRWIKGASRDGGCIEVRMAPNWKSKSGEPSDFDGGTGTEPVPQDPENGGTDSVPASTEPVPGTVPNRYRGGTEPVPPSENKEGVKRIQNKEESKAPVALTGSGSENREPGASLIMKEETACGAGTPASAPRLSPELAAALREEARLWTEQVAATLNRGFVRGRNLQLKRRDGRDPVKVVSEKAVGSSPWPKDVEAVYGYAVSRYPDADPVLAFRSVIRACAIYKRFAQAILGHACRMQASKGYARPRIKLCSLLRLDNTGVDVPDSCRETAGIDTGQGNLLERARELESTEPAPVCVRAPDQAIEKELRSLLDPRGRHTDACWDGCWKEASARCAASTVPVRVFVAYVAELGYGDWGYTEKPVPWVADSVDPVDLYNRHAESIEAEHGFCDNWGPSAGS